MVASPIKAIYTDGACSGNPGPGGWGVVVYFEDGAVHEIGGADRETTNNRMEMQAAIAALQFFQASGQRDPITLYTDSEYVKNGITKWIHGWKKKGWQTAAGKPVLNKELWQLIDQHNSKLVNWAYVRGHSGDVGNDRCDAIARAFATGRSIQLRQAPKPEQLENSLSLTSVSSTSQAPSDPVRSHSKDEPHLLSESSTSTQPVGVASDPTMTEFTSHASPDLVEELPREVRVAQIHHLLETLRMADEIASQGYLITSSELADLMDVNASAVTSRGDNWVWRNWVVSRVRREGNQILWQLERVD